MDYVMRDMTADDIAVVLGLEREIFTEAWSRDDFEFCVEDGNEYPFVLEADGSIVGYCVIAYIVGECEISNVAVAKEHRGQGLGRALMDRMLLEAKRLGASKVMLEVRAGNVPARTMYDSYGFTAVGCRKGYYTHPTEDAILMDLVL